MATAAHCVYQGGAYRGHGTAESYAALGKPCQIVSALTPPEWRENPSTPAGNSREQTRWDYAGLGLDCGANLSLGYRVGWLRMRAGDHKIDHLPISRPGIDCAGFNGFYVASGGVSYTSTYYDHLKYYFQGGKGCSGAPVWDQNLDVLAIVSSSDPGDQGGNAGAAAERATRIDGRVFLDLEAYKTRCTTKWYDGCNLHS